MPKWIQDQFFFLPILVSFKAWSREGTEEMFKYDLVKVVFWVAFGKIKSLFIFTNLMVSPPSSCLVDGPKWSQSEVQRNLISYKTEQKQKRERSQANKNRCCGLPWWHSGWESACQCRAHGFEPWSGKIPHAAEQLRPWATTTEPARLEPVLHNKGGRDSEWPPLAATRESPRTETKTQHSQK